MNNPLAFAAALAKVSRPGHSDHTPNYDHVNYLYPVIRVEELRKTITGCLAVLQRYEFDALAFAGNSGALITPSLALALDKTMLMVRKPGVNCHSAHGVEGDLGARKYIIVDDIISSGATVKNIVKQISLVAPTAKCLGVLEFERINLMLADLKRPLSPTRAYCYYDSTTNTFE